MRMSLGWALALACVALAGCARAPESVMAGVHGLDLRAPALAAYQGIQSPEARHVTDTARVELLRQYLLSLGRSFHPAQATPARPELSCAGWPNYRFYLALDGTRLYLSFDGAIQQADISDAQRDELLRITGQPRDLMSQPTPGD
jgi:hypothetical protein